MDWNIFYYFLYGFFAGLGELLPVSSAAHGFLVELMTRFDTMQPLLLLCIHGGCFLAVCISYWRRIGHITRELQIEAQPSQKRKRQPDWIAVMDAKVIFSGLIPLVVAIGFSVVTYKKLAALPILSVLLVVSGIVLYIPQFLPGANKDSRSLSRKDGLVLGLYNAVGLIPGFSRVGTMISGGLMKGCDRGYILDIAMLASLPALLGLMIVDTVMLIIAGGVADGVMIVYCLFSAIAAFGGAWLGMMIMRFLSVKSNFYGFAYYNWGLGLFSFLVYLMI